MKKTFLLWVVVMLGFGASLVGAQEDVEIVAQGCGASHKAALLEAKRACIEQGIGTVLVSQTEVENFILKKDMVLTKTQGAIRRYEELGTTSGPEGECVTIRGLVSLADIREDLIALRILLESMERPRMMVLMEGDKHKIAESAIIDYLTGKEFDVVDAAMTATLQQQDPALVRQAVAGDPVAAAKIGADNGAEYILIGTVKATPQHNELLAQNGMYSARAQIAARVVNCANARIVASKNSSSAAAHIAEISALQQAVSKSARDLMDTKMFEGIVTSFQDQVNNGQALEIRITGLESYAAQKDLIAAISALDSVRSFNKRAFTRGELIATVMYQGSADDFCDRVDGQKQGDKILAVTDVMGSRIVMALK